MGMLLVCADLPDPRPPNWPSDEVISLGLRERNFVHLAKHWTREKEPWGEILGPSDVAIFHRYLDREFLLLAEHVEAVHRALSSLGAQLVAAMRLPSVLIAPSSPEPTRKLDPACRLLAVLPGGAYAWIFSGNSEFILDSCYIPSHACVIPPEDRWKYLVRHLVMHNAYWNPKIKEYQPPPVGKTRFVTHSTWGFDDGSPQRIWRAELVKRPEQVGPGASPATVQLVSPKRPGLSHDE